MGARCDTDAERLLEGLAARATDCTIEQSALGLLHAARWREII